MKMEILENADIKTSTFLMQTFFNATLYFKFEEVSGIRLTKQWEGVLIK